MQLSTRSRKEDAFCVFALLILAGAFTTLLPRMQGIELVDGEANPYSTAANAGILAGLMLLVALSWSKVVFVCRHGGVMNLLALLCLLSILWLRPNSKLSASTRRPYRFDGRTSNLDQSAIIWKS